jgi:hypothetical protein
VTRIVYLIGGWFWRIASGESSFFNPLPRPIFLVGFSKQSFSLQQQSPHSNLHVSILTPAWSQSMSSCLPSILQPDLLPLIALAGPGAAFLTSPSSFSSTNAMKHANRAAANRDRNCNRNRNRNRNHNRAHEVQSGVCADLAGGASDFHGEETGSFESKIRVFACSRVRIFTERPHRSLLFFDSSVNSKSHQSENLNIRTDLKSAKQQDTVEIRQDDLT